MRKKNCCPGIQAAVHSLSWPAGAPAFEIPAISSTQPPLLDYTDANGRIFQKSFTGRRTIVRSGHGSGVIGCPTGSESFLKETALKPRIRGDRLIQAA